MEDKQQNGCFNLLTTKDVAAKFGVAVKTLSEWRSLGKGPQYIRLNGSVRYDSREIAAYLAVNTVEPAIPVPFLGVRIESDLHRLIQHDKGQSGKNKPIAGKRSQERVNRQKLRRKKKSS